MTLHINHPSTFITTLDEEWSQRDTVMNNLASSQGLCLCGFLLCFIFPVVVQLKSGCGITFCHRSSDQLEELENNSICVL